MHAVNYLHLINFTLTTSAAFLSFYLAESTMGDIVGPIFVVISMALLSSDNGFNYNIVLFLVLKMELKSEKPSIIDRIIKQLKGVYKNYILLALTNKVKVIIGIFILFIVSLYVLLKWLLFFQIVTETL